MPHSLPNLRRSAASIGMALCVLCAFSAAAKPSSFGNPGLDATMDALVQRLDRCLVSSGSLQPDQRPETIYLSSFNAEVRQQAPGGGERLCRTAVVSAARRGKIIAQLQGLACQSPHGWALQD
jgi:hypothetical protein